MAGFDINEIKSQLTYGGARQNQFQVQIHNPANTSAFLKTPFMVSAASLPSSDIGTIPVYYFGRAMKEPGDRTFGSWSVNVYNDEDFLIRNAMEEWHNQINRLRRNIREIANPKSSATVTQFSKTGQRIRTYEFIGLFPASISAIDLDWSTTDQIEQFQVTFEYDYWTISSSLTGSAGGE